MADRRALGARRRVRAASAGDRLFSDRRHHDSHGRIRCSSFLRQIGLAAKLYANSDPLLRYPMSLGQLVATQEITADVFVCPESTTETRATTDVKSVPTTQGVDPALADLAGKIDDPAGRHTSYLWAGDGLRDDAPADAVLAFEKPDAHDGDGVNVLYADGHTDWVALGKTGPARQAFERFMADWRAGKRPLMDWTTPPTP